MERTLERLAEAVPAQVLEVCRGLSDAGREAWTVGGAVRDVLLGRVPGDWDVCTDALPGEVQEIFARTIPTGIDHGTVTVVAGRGRYRFPVEVTSFRGEGNYSDARRPDEVRFGVPLDEDLARRDFVVNAIAFDPLARRLHDPYGGVGDIRDRRLRAVGVARERFLEDGLRVMRAVRFVAVLDFSLDGDTEAAIPDALSSLAKVSQERVRVELFKLVVGPAAVRALEIARARGVLDVVFPELAAIDWPLALARMEAADLDPPRRLAALAADVDPPRLESALRRLTVSNADRQRVVAAVASAGDASPPPADDTELRRRLSRIGRSALPDVLALWAADSAARGRPAELEATRAAAAAIVDRGDPLSARELSVTGKDVMDILGIAPGREIGELLEALLDRVLADPSLNRRDRLEALLRELGAPA